MLYIDYIGNHTFRMCNHSGGNGYRRYFSDHVVARSDENDRIWIEDSDTRDGILNCYPVSDITLDNIVHGSAADFVNYFNVNSHIGSKLNYFNPALLGLVSDAFETNDAANIEEIYYQVNGTDYALDIFVPIKNSLFAKYQMIVDLGDFIRLGNTEIGEFQSLLTLKDNYDSKTGTWNVASPPNHYASSIGATFTFTFTGSKLEFYSAVDNRGGLWSFSIDGAEAIEVSVWNDTFTTRTSLISDNLENIQHTVIATFLGQDPLHPYATPRGWAYFGDEINYGTFNVYQSTFVKDSDIQSASNKEFAFLIKKYGSEDTTTFTPYHGVKQTNVISRKIIIDDIEITDFTAGTIKKCTTVQITAKYEGFNFNNTEEILTEINTFYQINKYGYFTDYSIRALLKINIDGYGNMFPTHRDFGTLLETNLPETYILTDSDAVVDYISNGDLVRSLRITSSLTGKTNYQLTSALVNLAALRIGASDRGLGNSNNILWIENRDSALIQKMYWTTFRGSVMEQGDLFRAKSITYVGCIE